jgi:hypothetical protein
MSSITLYPDIPCTYPDSLGAEIVTSVGTTPVVLGAFRNVSSIPNIRGILRSFKFQPANASDDTVVTYQMIGGPTVTGGTWVSITNSVIEINKTATSVTGGVTALTQYSSATAAHGNTPAAGSFAGIEAGDMGLALYPNDGTFAIYAFTQEGTVDVAWSVNWVEKD